MISETVRFYSDGVAMAGILRLPEGYDPSTPLPVIVHPPGWLGLAEGKHYLPWHECFTEANYAVFVFDYRGFGDSGGERGWVRYDWQVEDLLAAVSFVSTREEIDPMRIGCFGMGVTGGGNAIIAAASEESIRCVVAQTVIADGADWLRRMRKEHEWVEYVARVRSDRVRWAKEGSGATAHPREELMVEPPERHVHNPRRDVDEKLTQQFYLRNADLTMRYRPIDYVERISPRALMLVSIKDDVFTFEDHASALYQRAGSPKKLLRQTNTTHWEGYTENFDEVSSQMIDWFNRYMRTESIEVYES